MKYFVTFYGQIKKKKNYKLKIIGDKYILSLNIMFSDENIR